MTAGRRLHVLLCAGVLCCSVQFASAQGFAQKPIRIVAAGVGSGGDSVARVIAGPLGAALGQPVVVDNRPGSAVIPGVLVAKAPPDGNTLLIHGSAVWLLPFMQDNVPYDPVRDFAAVTLLMNAPTLLVIHPSLPVKSVKELVGLAKARPGQLNIATYGTGNATHLAAELLKIVAAVDIARVNYRSAGTALNDILAGQVQLMFAPVPSVSTQLKAGRLRALAATTSTPSVLAPGIPTLESVLPGYGEVATVQGMLAPAQTPAAVISRLNQETVKILQRADVREILLNLGVEPVGSTPQAFADKIKAEMARWGKIIRDLGIREN